MPLYVKAREIDRDNNPVGEPRMLATFEAGQAAQSFIEGEIARFDHSGFVPDGPQAGWWGRNDRDPFEKFHFWIDNEGPADVPPPVREKQYRGLP